MPAKEQDVTISIKAKLYPDQKTIEEFKKLTTAYSEVATWLSGLMFNDFSSPEMITDCRTLHDKYYYDIRQKKDMKSQLAESLIRSVSAKYRAIDTTLKKQYYAYTDTISIGQTLSRLSPRATPCKQLSLHTAFHGISLYC